MWAALCLWRVVVDDHAVGFAMAVGLFWLFFFPVPFPPLCGRFQPWEGPEYFTLSAASAAIASSRRPLPSPYALYVFMRRPNYTAHMSSRQASMPYALLMGNLKNQSLLTARCITQAIPRGTRCPADYCASTFTLPIPNPFCGLLSSSRPDYWFVYPF